jgi:hypothetical protein
LTRTPFRFLVFMISLIALVHLAWGDAALAQSGKQTPPATLLELPDGLFGKDPPANPLAIKLVKGRAQQGETVILFGRVSGRAVPFVEGRAVFLMADTTLPPCSCGCPTPWDLCCSPPNVVMEGLVTIQVLGPDGRPLKATLQNVNGLQPMANVVVQGRVAKRDMNVFVVSADRIYVIPSSN